MKQLIILFLILLLPSVTAYEAIIKISGTLKSPKGLPITAYAPRMRIYDAPPNVQQEAPLYDTGVSKPEVGFSSLTKYVQLESGKTYYVTMEFTGLCTGPPHQPVWVSSPGNCAVDHCQPPKGGCWGFCTANDPNNFKRNRLLVAKCESLHQDFSSARWLSCGDAQNRDSGPCDAARDDSNNPVFPTTTIPGETGGSLVFGADENLIEFTAP